MPDFEKMSLQSLRDLAKKTLGPGYSRLKTKADLVAALERAARAEPEKSAAKPSPRPPAGRAAEVAGKAVRAVRAAGKAARAGAKAAAAAGRAAASAATAGAGRAAKGTKGAGKARAAVAGAVAGAAAAVRARALRPEDAEGGAQDPEGYFVARVRGEEAARDAPHPMVEADAQGKRAQAADESPRGVGMFDEGLGDLPWAYGDDAFVALPRDPRTLFVYWDWSNGATHAAFEGMDTARVQLWVFARAGDGWDRARTLECALESRGYYVHDLEPGRTYRGELHAVDRLGRERLIGRSSNEVALPPVGPSPIIDDRFLRLPWEVPLGELLGPGHAGGAFSDDARALFSRLSDWSRFQGRVWGGSAGGMGGRPFSPTSGPSSPAPTSPSGPYGRGEE